jgi:ABC-2 type transport system permease protein
MAKLRPASLPWLLWWDLRLAWRGLAARLGQGREGVSRRRVFVQLGLTFLLLHLFGWSVVFVGGRAQSTPAQLLPPVSVFLLATLLSATGAALATAVNQIFVRGDLDLLSTAPVPTHRVFAARSLSIAVQAVLVPALLLLPAANVGLVTGRGLRWLTPYPMTFALGLTAAALGMSLTVLLVRTLGPKRARIAALVLSTLLGSALLVALQLPNLPGKRWLRPDYAIDPQHWIWLPARAMLGEPDALAACLGVATLLFGTMAAVLPRAFAFALGSAAGVESGRRQRRAAPPSFRAGLWRLMFAKEWRLVLRDPQLLVLLGQQLIGFIPAFFILARRAGSHEVLQHTATAALLTLVGSVTADTLIWLAICAEDMPDLLACSPHPRGRLRRIKLLVVLLPLWLPALAFAAWLAWPDARLFCALAAGVTGGSLGVGVFHLWLPDQGSRKDIRRRYHSKSGSPPRMLAALGMQFGWAALAAVLASPHPWAALAILPFALAGPAYAWLRRNEGAVLRY